MTPIKAVLRATCGSPYRLVAMGVAASGLGFLFYQSADTAALSPVARPVTLCIPAVVVFIGIVLGGLLTALGTTVPSRRDMLLQLLASLPLSNRRLWLLSLLPQCLAALYALLLGGGGAWSIFSQLGMPPILLVACATVGTLSSFGIVYGLVRTTPAVSLAVMPILGYAMYKSIAISLSATATNSDKAIVTVTFAIGCTICSLRFLAGHAALRHQLQRSARTPVIRRIVPDSLLGYAKKYVRHASIRLSLAVTMLLSGSIAAGIHYSHMPVSTALLPLVSLLCAACCSDTRGITERYNPADSTALTGTYRFFARQAVTSFTATTIAILPLWWIAIVQGVSLSELVIFAISGVTTGLFASTLIIPMHRDITSQITATLLCLILLVGVPHFVPVWVTYQTTAMLWSASLLAVAALGIEYRRNSFSWRRHGK